MTTQRRTTADWLVLIEEYEQSGLTQTQFCDEKGLNFKYFSLRRSRLKKQTGPDTSNSDFIRVMPSGIDTPASSAVLIIPSSQGQLQIHGVTPGFIAELVQRLT